MASTTREENDLELHHSLLEDVLKSSQPAGLKLLSIALLALSHFTPNRVTPIKAPILAQVSRLLPGTASSSPSFDNLQSHGLLYRQVHNPRGRYSALKMIDPFSRFDRDAIKVIMEAQKLQQQMRKKETTVDMILYGCIAQGTGVAANILKGLGVTPNRVQERISKTTNKIEGTTVELSLAACTRRILEKCLELSDTLGSPGAIVDTVHMLLAIVEDEDNSGAKILRQLGVDLKVVRTLALNEIQSESGQEEDKATVGEGPSDDAPKKACLEEFATDLTKLAEDGKLDPVVGRQAQIERAIIVLARRRKNNPVLLGDPGVGKTAIAEGLAQRIVDRKVPRNLRDKRVFVLDVAGLLAGTRFRGEFEERLKNIIDEVSDAEGKIILMIDEIHTIVGAGGVSESGGSVDAGNMMKPRLASGELQVIGATTRDEYRKYIEKDKALERRFQPIDVPEPSVPETVEILKGIVYKYEGFHGLTYTPEAIEACATLASKYIQDRFLPDKAIDVLDETGAYVSLMGDPWLKGNDMKELVKELEEVILEKDRAEEAEDYQKCIGLQKRKNVLESIIEKESTADKIIMVSEANVSAMVSKSTGIPVSQVASNESAALLNLEETLHERVIGQDEAVIAVSKAVRRARSGLKDPNRPIASFIFAGPTGVGKTELCKALSTSYYSDEKAMIRFDMSEFMEKFSVSKLIGSPPGYVGYDDGSQLCDRIRRNPYSLVLFDEIEKAHPDVFNIMLQILDDGRLTDSKGRVVSFKNALIVMTSNVGAQNIEKTIDGGGAFGFDVAADTDEATYDNLKKALEAELKHKFRPEFINRLDDTIVFRPLTKENVRRIAELEFEKVVKRVREQYNATVELTENVKDKVLEEGFDPKFGARPLRRAVTRLLEDELSNSLLADPFVDGEFVLVDTDGEGEVVVRRSLLLIKQFNKFLRDEPVSVDVSVDAGSVDA